MAMQFGKFTKIHLIEHVKLLNFVVCKLYLHKVIKSICTHIFIAALFLGIKKKSIEHLPEAEKKLLKYSSCTRCFQTDSTTRTNHLQVPNRKVRVG